MWKSGDGALSKLKPATVVPKGCWVVVGDVVVDDVEHVDVEVLMGEREPGSAWRLRVGDCENAVRSFWRERAGERRWDGIVVLFCVLMLVDVECCIDDGPDVSNSGAAGSRIVYCLLFSLSSVQMCCGGLLRVCV
jgi:hypothetical protein